MLREIAEELEVSVTTAWNWTRDEPVPSRAVHGRSPEELRAMARARWDAELAVRDEERRRVAAAGAEWVGSLTEREVELVAVVAYWCEGSKSKPWARSEFLTFINSDPDVIRVFLRWLRQLGIPDDNLRLALSIHETADVPASERWWSEVVGVPVERFSKATLKRHTPKTVRKNVGADYHGCLSIGVRQSRVLYQRLTGMWAAIAAQPASGPDRGEPA